MRKFKFGINYAAVWILLGIFLILPIFIFIFIVEKSFQVLFSKNPVPEVVHAPI